LAGAELGRYGGEFAKARFDKTQAPARLRGEGLTASDGLRIAIERDHLGAACENGLCIAAGAERPVQIDSALLYAEGGDDLVKQDGNVVGRSASSGLPLAAAHHHSRAPCGAARALAPSSARNCRARDLASSRWLAKRPGSQI
jgi:hypothetical protein